MSNKPTTSARVFSTFEGKVRLSHPGIIAPRDKQSPAQTMHPDVQRLMRMKRMRWGTEECMRSRTLGVSSTDFATLVHRFPELRGSNKYQTVNKLTRKKMGLVPREESPACKHGVFYEPEALRVYTLLTGNELADEVGWVKGGPFVPFFIGATPDAVCKYKPILVEIKCPFYKQSLECEIPDIYWPQVQTQMAVTGIHTVHLMQYFPPDLVSPGEVTIFEAKFDPVWWKRAVEIATNYYYQVLIPIQKGEKPVPSAPTKKRLNKRATTRDMPPRILVF